MRVRLALAMPAVVALSGCCLDTGVGDDIGGGSRACRRTAEPGFVSTLANIMPMVEGNTSFTALTGVAVDPAGNVVVFNEGGPGELDRIDCAGKVTVLASNIGGNIGMVMDAARNVFGAATWLSSIVKIDSSGRLTTLAGTGAMGFADGVGGANGIAQFNQPEGIAIDASGNLYVADTENQRIRKIDLLGNVTTIAGDGVEGYLDGPALTARFDEPARLAIDAVGNIYVADARNTCVRKISAAGDVSTLAGHSDPDKDKPGTYVDGTGGPNGTARFVTPGGLAVDGDGNVYVADISGYRVRKIDTRGNVTTVAGNGSGVDADGSVGPTGTASFAMPCDLTLDGSGHVYVSDHVVVRMISL